MKVALLLFGQPRNVDNLKVINSHKEYILNKYDTDVFCHTYYSENCDYDLTPKCGTTMKSSKNAVGIIETCYKPVSFVVDEPFDNKRYREHKNNLNSEHFKTDYDYKLAAMLAELYTKRKGSEIFCNYFGELNFGNLLSQMNSITAVCKLFDVYSKNNNIKYDFCILTRYDFFIRDFPALKSLDQNYYYVPNFHKWYPDIIHVFNPRYICANFVYDNLEQILRKFINDKEPYDTSYNGLKSCWELQGECVRYNSYILHFSNSNIRTVYIPYNRNV